MDSIVLFLQPGKKVITSISYSKHSGLIASGSTDKYVRLWDPKSTGKSTSNSSLVVFNFDKAAGKVDFVDQKHQASEKTKQFTFLKNRFHTSECTESTQSKQNFMVGSIASVKSNC